MAPNLPKTLRLRRVSHLAVQLNISADALIDVSERVAEFYHDFDRDVKGKLRHLTMARPPLGPLQRRILDRILCRLPVSKHAYGAIKGRSIRDNAVVHASAPFLAKLDIRDFYPSIRYQRIHDFFIEQECSPDVARILTLLTTRKHALPLGTATSPFLADQIVHPIDDRIGGLARSLGLRYTRYVDDVTLSGKFDLEQIVDKVITIIKQSGFNVKRSKLEIYRPGDDKEKVVTGVRVQDGRTSAPSNYIELLRDELNQAREQSLHEEVVGDFDTRQHYLGKIGYVKWLDPDAGRKLLRIYRRVKWRHLEWAQKRRHHGATASPTCPSAAANPALQ